MNYVTLSLGSNSGNKLLNLKLALKLLPIKIIKISSVYENAPLLPKFFFESWKQKFLNMVVIGITILSPFEFLRMIKIIEKKLGRNNKKLWSPRSIDIDIIFWNNLILNSKKLKIPHLQMHTRDFVLIPLCEIDFKIIHPVLKKRAHELLLNVQKNQCTLKHKSSSIYL